MSDSKSKTDNTAGATVGAGAPSAAETVKLDAAALRKLVVSTVLQVEDDVDGDAEGNSNEDRGDAVVAAVGADRRRV